MPQNQLRPTREQVANGMRSSLFHATSRPRPLLVLERRSLGRFEPVIDLRDDDPDGAAHEDPQDLRFL